jgi:hypothetical protein
VRVTTTAETAGEAIPQDGSLVEVRGEGIFLRIDDSALAGWEPQVADSEVVREHKEAFGRFRTNRYSGRIKADFDAMYGWPGARYIARCTP